MVLFSIFNLARLGVAMDTVPSHTLVIPVTLKAVGVYWCNTTLVVVYGKSRALGASYSQPGIAANRVRSPSDLPLTAYYTALFHSPTWTMQGGMRVEGLLSQKLVWIFTSLLIHLMLFRRMSTPLSEALMVVFVLLSKSYHWKKASSVGGTLLHRRRRELAQTSAVLLRPLHRRSVPVRTSFNPGTHSFIRPLRSFHPPRTVHTRRLMAANRHISAQLSATRRGR